MDRSAKPFVTSIPGSTGRFDPSRGHVWRPWPRGTPLEYGLNVRVLEPGRPNCYYHRESHQEDFLVLAGECLVILNGEEIRLKAWDFVHCPPGTDHVFVAAGDGPCAILMIGSEAQDVAVHYPVSEVAAKYGASARKPCDDPDDAYADWPREWRAAPFPFPFDGPSGRAT